MGRTTTIKEANEALRREKYVFAIVKGERKRIMWARSKMGELQVRVLNTGKWETAEPSSLEVAR
jgi:hypothetical protein